MTVPYITPKMGYLMTAATIQQLPDDDERAAAAWFMEQENAELIQPSQLADLDANIYPVLWIEIDRVGLPLGWENLPAEITSDETIAALRQYSANGGSLYLSNMATQLTVPLGFVPSTMPPTTYGNGEGGTGTDVWTINPYLGWDFRNGSIDDISIWNEAKSLDEIQTWQPEHEPDLDILASRFADDFRDPYFFRNGDNAYIIVGSSKNGVGTTTLHRYNPLTGMWSNDGDLFFTGSSAAEAGTFWEMPNITPMPDGRRKVCARCRFFATASGRAELPRRVRTLVAHHLSAQRQGDSVGYCSRQVVVGLQLEPGLGTLLFVASRVVYC